MDQRVAIIKAVKGCPIKTIISVNRDFVIIPLSIPRLTNVLISIRIRGVDIIRKIIPKDGSF